MKISLKTFLILAPFIFLISCSDISNKDEAAVTWDATNYTFYQETGFKFLKFSKSSSCLNML